VPNYENKGMVFLAAGDFNANPAAKEVAEAFAECGGARLCGLISDTGDAVSTAKAISDAAQLAARVSEKKTPMPPTYRSFGAYKIFRDLVYKIPFVFRADFRFYNTRGMLKFPNTELGVHMQKLVMGLMMSVPRLRKDIRKNFPKYMLARHQELIEKEKADK